MSDMRAHILLTADGRSVVLTSRQAKAALSGVKTETLGAGEAAARADIQQEGHAKAMMAGRRAAVMLTAALGGLAAGFSAGALINASVTMDGIDSTLLKAAGSAAGVKAELAFLSQESERLGINFEGNAASFARTAAAADGTALAGQGVRDIWLGVAEAGVVLGRSQAELEGALTAIEQMISKGVVSSEELRGQLGERLPGAFEIAARSMGVTTQELGKMLESGEILAEDFLPKFAAQLRSEFGDSLGEAIAKPAREIERLKNDLFDFQVDVAGAGFMDGLIEGIHSLREVLADPAFREDAKELFNAIGQGAALGGDALVFLTRNIDLLRAGVLGVVGVKFAKWLSLASARLTEKTVAVKAAQAATLQATQAELAAANASAVKAKALVYQRQMQLASTQTKVAATIATVKLTQAENAAALAATRVTAARTAATAATGRMAIATRGLGAAMGFLGGPLGVALVGITALTYAMKLYGEATAAKLEDGAAELDLIQQLDTASQGMASITRDNASAKLLEAEAIREKVKAQRDEIAAARESVGARIAPFMGTEVLRASGVASGGTFGSLISGAATAKAELENVLQTIRLTQEEAAALDLLGDPDLEARKFGGGYTIALGRVKDALQASGDETTEWAGRVKVAEGNVEAIRARIQDWGRVDDQRVTSALTKGEMALAQYRAQLDLTTQQAARTQEAAKTEEIAFKLVNKAKAAGVELSLEAARIEAARHVQQRAQFEARKDYAQLEAAQQERRTAAFETPEQTQRRQQALELFTAAQTAGLTVTLEEISARLKHIDVLEAEEEARAAMEKAQAAANDNYEEWLDQRDLDIKLAGLTNEEREIELLLLDRINLAGQAGIQITEAQARAWAQNHVARLDQLERERDVIKTVYDAYEEAADDIDELWTGTWEDIWAGNFDTIDDFAGDVGDIFKKLAKQIAAQMIIKPILDQSGLGAILGVPGLGGGGSLLGSVAGSAAGGAIGGGLGTALFGAAGIGGLFGGGGGAAAAGGFGSVSFGGLGGGLSSSLGGIGSTGGLLGAINGGLAALPGIGGILSSGSAAISGALAALPGIGSALGPLAASLGPLGLVAGAAFGLTQILKKKPPRLKSYFGTTASGDIGITRSETRRTDAGTTNEIANSINQVLDRLGVTLSGAQNFTVLYKPEKDYLDVNFGDGRVFNGGADDAGEAIAYAVSELLKGPVEGLNRAVQAQIRAAGTITDVSQLDEILSEFAQAQSFSQGIADEINRRENPERLELDTLERAQEARRDEIERFAQLGYVTDDVIAQLDRLEQIELDEVLTRLGATAETAGEALSTVASEARSGIQRWLEDLNISNDNAPLSPQQRRDNAQTAFDAQLILAQAGDEDALSSITDYADQLLALDREATSSAADRAALYNSIVSALEGLAEPAVIDPMAGVIGGLEQVEGRIAGLPGQITPPITDGLSAVQGELPAGFALIDGQLVNLSNLNASEFGLMRGRFSDEFGSYGDVFEDRMAALRSSVEGQSPFLSPLSGRLGNLESLIPAGHSRITTSLAQGFIETQAVRDAISAQQPFLSPLGARLETIEQLLPGGHQGIISGISDMYARQDIIRSTIRAQFPTFEQMSSRLGNINSNTVTGSSNVVSRVSDVWSRLGLIDGTIGAQLPEFVEMRTRLGNINGNTVTGTNSLLSGIDNLRVGTLSELGTLNSAVSQDLITSNDNFVSALNDNIGLMRGDLLELRNVTSSVNSSISTGTSSQLAALSELIEVNEETNRVIEQGGGSNGGGSTSTN